MKRYIRTEQKRDASRPVSAAAKKGYAVAQKYIRKYPTAMKVLAQ